MRQIYLSILFSLSAFVCQAQDTWVNKSPFSGSARGMSSSFSVSGTGYIVGGFTQYPGVWVNEVWAYSPSADSWVQKNNFPAATAGGATLAFGDSVYVIGGYVGSGNNSSANYFYNPGSDSWTAKADFPENGVGGAFQFVVNGLGYVGTGERNGHNNSTSVYAYNPSLNTWGAVASYPESLVNTVGFAIAGFGYAGLGSDGSNNLSTGFYKYSPSSNTWSPIAAFPGEPRSSAMSFVLGGKAYVGGGWTLIPGSSNVIYDLGDFYCYDPSTDTWTAVPGAPGRAREHSNTFTLNDNAYLVGGYDDYISGTVTNVAEFGTCNSLTAIIPIPGGNNQAKIAIYPNPSTNDVTVKIGSPVTSEIKYEIVSVDGKVIKTGSTTQDTFGFSANSFADGVYILSITDNSGTHGAGRFEVMH